MKLIEKYYYNRGMKFKLLIFYILSIFIIVTTIAVAVSRYVVDAFVEEQNGNRIDTINQIKHNLEINISNIEDLTYYLYHDYYVNKFLSKDYLPEEEEELIKNVKNVMAVHQIVRKNIGGMILVRSDGEYISNDMVVKENKNILNDDWFKEALVDTEKIVITNKPIDRNVKSAYDYYSADNMISISKSLDSSSSGVILVDLKADYIKDIIFDEGDTNGEKVDDSFYYLVDNDFNVLFAPVNKVAYRINNSNFKNMGDDGLDFSFDNKEYKILYSDSIYLDNKLVGVFSLSLINEIVDNMIIRIASIGIITMLVGTVIAIMFSNMYVRPITKLKILMKRAEDGELDVQFNSKYKDEIGQLGYGFNSMLQSIKSYTELVKVEQQGKKEAELRAFQMQIKPHFLYNTLDTVKWIAKDYEAHDIVEIISSLSSFFRIGISKGKEIITLENEIKHLESYMSIQLVRYREMLEYEIDSDEDLRYTKVTKFILQPIVENAIYHGIKPKEGRGLIEIKIYRDKDILVYEVIDDGVGITDEKLLEINGLLKNGKSVKNDFGIGVSNVNERIKLTYGNEYGVVFHKANNGTRVVVTQPFIEVEDVCIDY